MCSLFFFLSLGEKEKRQQAGILFEILEAKTK